MDGRVQRRMTKNRTLAPPIANTVRFSIFLRKAKMKTMIVGYSELNGAERCETTGAKFVAILGARSWLEWPAYNLERIGGNFFTPNGHKSLKKLDSKK